MKRKRMLCIAAGLLLLAGCGSAAPSTQENLFSNGPALVAVDGENDENEARPNLSAAPKEQAPDLRTMSAEEESSYALFCNIMSESGFREMIRRDDVDFLPDHMAHIQGGPIAYFKDRGEVVVICDEELSWFQHVPAGSFGSGRVCNALWLDADRLLVLMDADTAQRVCLYAPATQQLDVVYVSPEGRAICEIRMDDEGNVTCLLAPEEPLDHEEALQSAEAAGETGEAAAVPAEKDADPSETPSQEEVAEPQQELVTLVLPEGKH